MIRKIQYDGFDAVEITTEILKMVLVYGTGPRVAFFGRKDGENLLYWDKKGASRGDWKIYGGHRVWMTRPMADESEDAYLPDNEPCTISVEEDSVTAAAPVNPVNRIIRGMTVRIESDRCISVRDFLTNDGQMIYSGGVWSPVCILPEGKKIRIPLGQENTTWDLVRIVIPRIFAGNHTVLEDDQVSFSGNDLVVVPRGRVVKRVCCAPKGKLILENGEYSFQIYSPYQKSLRYPFEGCNMACFVADQNTFAELETYGGESEIIPGATIENMNYWSVLP